MYATDTLAEMLDALAADLANERRNIESLTCAKSATELRRLQELVRTLAAKVVNLSEQVVAAKREATDNG